MKRILTLIILLHFFYSGFCTERGLYDSLHTINFSANSLLNGPGDTVIAFTGHLCTGGNPLLTANSAPAGATFQWMLNGSNISGATASTYMPTQIGNYSVVANGSITYPPITITANPDPIAGFMFSPNAQCSNIPIQFTDTSKGTGLSYLWDFGDPASSNNASTTNNPSHKFIGTSGSGTQSFPVQLTVTNNLGCTDVATSNLIKTKQSSSTLLAGDGQTTYNGLTYFTSCSSATTLFNFANQSTTTNTNYQILWGDGTNDIINPFSTTTHTYSLGNYTLDFIVTNQNGCIDTGIYNVFVGSNPAVGLGNPGNTSICTGSSLTFPVSNTSSNSLGTVYIVTFNDGSAPINFGQTAPTDVTHAFLNSSCDTNSSTYNNSFSATIQASNPCQSSSATVVPIYVSQKPVAAFSISPNDTVCVNNTVTLTNTNPLNKSNINGTCTVGKFVWQITPATGWTLTSGALGNDLNLSNTSLWTTGSNSVGISFTQTGTYSIKLKIGGNIICGIDSITKTICVNQLPIANFTIDNNIGCAPLNVNATNNPSPTTCGNNTYNWTVTYTSTAGCTPTTAAYTFIGGTNATSINPQFQFTNPGVYTISLITTSPGGGCMSAPYTQTVTVKGKPVATLTAPVNVCLNQSITPSITATCYTTLATYSWSFAGGSPATSGVQSPGTIVYNTSGGPYNISVDVTNECGTTNSTQSITVITVPQANAGPTQNTCGPSVTMAANAATPATGTWITVNNPVGTNPLITSVNAPNTTITNLVTPGMYVFQWKISNGTCSTMAYDTVNISTGPTTAVAGPDQDLCTATSTTLAANAPSIGTGKWTYISGQPGYTITDNTNPATTITGLVPGVYVFRWTISFSNCPPSTDDVQITIDAAVTPSNAGATQSICGVTNATMAANAPTVGTGLWTVVKQPAASPNPTITPATSPTAAIGNLSPGMYVFTWTISNGACSSASNDTINVFASPTTANAGTDQHFCHAIATTLAANAPSVGTGLWSFISGPTGYTITTPASPTSTLTGLVPGVYDFRWTISYNTCPSSTDDVFITIYDSATVSNAGPAQTICGTTANMNANTATVGTGLWTVIKQPVASPNPTIIPATSPTATIGNLVPGMYVFQWTITNGDCSSSSNDTINISNGPTKANAGLDQELCLATSVTLAATPATTGTGVWSFISGPAGYTITTPSLYNTTVTNLVPGVYLFQWTTSFSNCTPSMDTVKIMIDAAPTISNAGIAQNICGTSTATMAANKAVSGIGTWTVINNPSGTTPNITNPTSETTTITNLSLPGVYVFQWKISTGACSDSSTDTVTVYASPTISNAGPDQNFCHVASVTLAANAPTTGTGLWSLVSGPAGYIITTPASPTSTVTGLIPGTYTFRWTISYNNCTPSTDDVVITIYDSATVSNAGALQNICGTTATMAANKAIVGIGKWTVVEGPNNPTIIDSTVETETFTNLTVGEYIFKWTITNGVCFSESNDTVIISGGPTQANAGPDQEHCLATSVVLAGNNPSIGTGLWTFISGPSGYKITDSSVYNTSVTGLVPGKYIFCWTTSFSNCSQTKDSVTILIDDNATTANAGADQTICSSAVNLYANRAVIGKGVWSQLSGNIGSVLTDASYDSTTVTGLTPGIYLFQWAITNGVCATSYDTVQITVAATATIPNAGADQLLCADTSTILIANTATTGKGVWSYIDGAAGYTISDTAASTTTIGGLKQGSIYHFNWSITNSVCPTLHDTIQITILDSLKNGIKNSSDTICSGQQIILTDSITAGGNITHTYQWQQSIDNINWTDIPSATNSGFDTILTTSTYFRRKIILDPCQSYSNTIFITVQPAIANNSISADQGICINTAGAIITGTIPTGGDGKYSYQWQLSRDGGQTWNDSAGATNKDIDPGVLTQTTLYRRNVITSLCSGAQANRSDTVTITVHPDSRAAFSESKIMSCAPFVLDTVIHDTVFAAGNGLYQWYANGTAIGNNTDGSFPGYTINNEGDTVMIKLITTSQYGCKPDSAQQQFVTVKTAFAHFTKDTSFGCEPLPVNFTNTTNIVPNTQFFWDFGNGQTFNNAQPSTITFSSSPFNTDTTYRVTLKAYNGCDTTIWIDSVKVRANPKARFGIDTTAGCSPFAVHINNTSLGAPNTYYWDFGNGHLDTTYTTGALNYTYNIGNAVDTFTIRLIAKNECKTDTSSINVRIAPNTIHAQVSINASDLYGCAPDIVSFNNSTTGATKLTWNFGDGTTPLITDNSQNPVTHTYTDSGTYTIAILATNNCSDTTVYKQVTVYKKPIAAFTTNAASYCVGDTVHTINNSQNATNYNWFFDDGTTSTNPAPTHIYTSAGNFTIYLRAERTNSFGLVCYDTVVQAVTVLAKPIVTIQSNINTVNCAPFTLNAAAPNITNEKATWYIYDSTLSPSIITASGNTAQHTFLKPGIYFIQLVAQNALGCTDSNKISFTIQGTPVASFKPNDLAICKTDTTIVYTNTSTYNGIDNVGYKWLVNNNILSTNANFTYHYTVAPNIPLPYIFNTILIATNSVGCSDTATAALQMNPLPKAQFAIVNPNACVPFVVSINNTSTYADTYKWLLNGIAVSTDAIPAIAITKASTNYSITLIANNSYGCKADTVITSFTSRIKPIASFKVNDTLGCTGKLNIVTTNTSNHASSYIWDWGDGTANTTFTSPTHLYSSLGQYLITLVASDGVCTDTANQLVEVSQKPVVDFAADRVVGCGNTEVQFTNLTSNAVSYLWSFGDGNTSMDLNPTNVYAPAAILYSVKLIATSDFGCKDSAIKANYIRAIIPPASGFEVLPGTTISIPDYTFSFNNLTINSANYKYLWALGDATFADTRDIASHQYADTGYYSVQLIVLDTTTNCTDTTIKVVRIQGYPGYLYVPNAFYPNSQRNEFRTFKPVGKGLADYDLQIFDSWGKLLFETKNLNIDGSPADSWDGTFNGKALPQDAYAWRITAHFRNGQSWDGMQYGSARKVTFGTVNLFR